MQEPKRHTEQFEDHTGLVGFVAQRIYATAQPQGFWEIEDFFQEGCIGLMKALDKFDPAKGVKFSTFAGTCIRNEILMYIRKQSRFTGTISIETPIKIQTDQEYLTIFDTMSHKRDEVEGEVIGNALYEFLSTAPKNYKRQSKRRDEIEARERLCFEMMIEGYRQVDIRDVLGVSQRVTAFHYSSIREKVRQEWGVM